MKQTRTRFARAALFFGTALIATPALAQDAPAVTPPPVAQTVPAPAPAPAPVQVTPPPVVPTMIQAVPDTPKPQTPPAEFRRAAPAPRAATTTRTTRTVETRSAPAPRAAAPAPAPEAAAPAPQPAAPAPAPVEAAAPPAAAPVTPPAETAAPVATETQTTQTSTGSAIWPWLLGGALLIVAAAAFLLFRRRREEDYAEEYYEEPAVVTEPVAEPVAVAPVAYAAPRQEPEVASRARPVVAEPALDTPTPIASAEDASVAEADAGDLAGIADGEAPVSNRPWLELGMRPLRAGTQAEEALVEIELIVGNAGDMAAEDVRISTFMLPAGTATSEMEELLIERANETAVAPVSIPAGEGKTIDATLAVHKADLAGDFTPVIVADARYRLPDGSEGRTSASFRIGLTDEDGNGLAPIAADHRGMNENVAAELEGAPARA